MRRNIEFNKDPSEFRGPIIDWYRTLRSTKISSLELHKIDGPGSSPLATVIVFMTDGSRYRLNRVPAMLKATILPEFVDTIEHVLHSDITTHPILRVKFKEGQRLDLLYVLGVCYGTRPHEPIFTAPRIVTDSDFFALALILNTTQKCLPERVISQNSTGSSLETLWKEVYTLVQSQGYAFWADKAAEHTKNMARELIYRAARTAIVLNMSGGDIDEDLSYAAAAVARVEVMAEKTATGDPAVWDKAWNNRWKETWQTFKLSSGNRTSMIGEALEGAFGGTMTGGSQEIPKPIVDGRIPGRVAGRTPMKLPLPPQSITLLTALALGSRLSTAPSYSMQCNSPVVEETSPTGDDGPHELINQAGQVGQMVPNGDQLSASAKECEAPILWLGRGRLNRFNDKYELWATPQEIAVEMAWAAAWQTAVDQGRAAATKILQEADKNRLSMEIKPEMNLGHGTPVVKARRVSMHPGLEGIMSVARGAGRLISEAGRRHSFWRPRVVDSGVSQLSSTPQATSLQSGNQTNRQSLTIVTVPQTNSGAVFERPSSSGQVPFPMGSPVSPSTSRRVSFPEIETASTHRNRGENFARNTLRKFVVSRRSDTRRHSDLEGLAAFNDAVRERKHREKKEDAQDIAREAMFLMVNGAMLTDRELERLAHDALRRAKQLSSNLEYSLQQLAKQEWAKVSQGRNLVASSLLPIDSTIWERGFIKQWEEAWRKSWMAAWRDVWNQAWNAAVARGVEFGVEEVLDKDRNASRINYRQLESKESFQAIKKKIEDKNLRQLDRLELVYSMMKELYSLHDLLRHSIPSIQDDSMEIFLQPKKDKSPPSSTPGTNNDGEKLTYFQLHQWIEHDYISKKFNTDPQLKESLKKLFVRGISEVWESASSVYKEKDLLSGDTERLQSGRI